MSLTQPMFPWANVSILSMNVVSDMSVDRVYSSYIDEPLS